MKKTLYIDLETGGLDSKKSPILQMAGLIEEDGKVIDVFDYKGRPFEGQDMSPEALKVNRLTPEIVKTFPPGQDMFKSLMAILDKHVNKYDRKDKLHIAGYNIQAFDSPFLRQFFANNGNNFYGSYFFHPTIDVMLIAAHKLMGQRHKMLNFKLGTVAKHLGIAVDEDKAHDALYDIELTRDILYKLPTYREEVNPRVEGAKKFGGP